ncbi:hypothetical protein PSNTI_45090 [Stutzerimonas stutzeri]|nr:hypothetical protein PSNTI_45090 [Stutzerimonas stutzeri]
MIAHERHRGRRHAAALRRPVAVFDHPPRQGSEQQVEQVVAVAAHQCAGEQQRLARLGRQHPHGLALCGAAVLVLVCLVGDEQVERALGKLPLDELGRLVAALAEAELHVGHRTFHPMGLPVREDQLAVAIHQVDELVDVVPEHRREEGVTELLHQLLRGDFPDGWNTLQCLEHGRLVAGGQAPGTDQRPQRCTAVAALAAGLLGFQLDRVDRLAVEVGDDMPAIRTRRHVAVNRAPANEDRFPVEPHPHPHAAQDEELLALGRHAQLLAQLQQLDQCVRAVEHPDLGAGHRLLDLAPPLVDQVGWREHQGTAVAFGVEHGGRGDADGRLAAAHLAVDDRGAFAAIDQQLGDGVDHIGLRREQLALQCGEDQLPMHPHLAGVDGRIGAVERIEQLVAELRYEVLQAEGEG